MTTINGQDQVLLLQKFYDSVFDLVDDMYNVGMRPEGIEKILICEVKDIVKTVLEK